MTPLRQRMLEDMAIRNFAENTQSSYIQQIISYAKHFHRAPEDLGPEEIRTYQLHLTQTRKLSASSVSVATGALRFLYKVTLPCLVPSSFPPFVVARHFYQRNFHVSLLSVVDCALTTHLSRGRIFASAVLFTRSGPAQFGR